MKQSTAPHGRKLIVQTPNGYVMDGKVFKSLLEATNSINARKVIKR